MRFGWVLKSAAVGIIVMLLICYVFSLALSLNAREYKMMNKLSEYKDNTFEYLRGSSDVVWLAAIGSLIALFAGGMTATLLSRPSTASLYKWLIPSAIVAIATMLVIDGYMLVTWNDSMQKWHQSPVDEYGRPFEPIVFPALLFLMVVLDAVCLMASAAGGIVAWISDRSQA
jgi:glucan phosphoethanolaminetransferase (alkaline phosphatase superfamily)